MAVRPLAHVRRYRERPAARLAPRTPGPQVFRAPTTMTPLPAPSCRFALFLAACAALSPLRAANWPGWRGPNGDGTTTTAKNLPETWSLTQNIKWKQEMPAWSGSSPIIWGDRIFLSSPSKEEVQPAPEPAP